MSFVGKMLVVVQLILSVCFMAFAGAVVAVQKSWKVEYQNASRDLLDARDALADKEEELTRIQDGLTAERDTAVGERNQFEGRLVAVTDERDQLQIELDRIKTQLNDQQSLNQIAGEEADMRRAEALVQFEVNKQLHQKLDDLTSQLSSLKDELFSTERSVEELTDRYNGILEELGYAKKFLALNDLEMPEDFRFLEQVAAPPPNVHGVVVDARPGKQRGMEFVEVSLGSDDGLAEGHSLFVFRTADQSGGRPKYLGRIQLVLLTPDRAVGTVIEKAKNGIIQRGDHVTTKL